MIMNCIFNENGLRTNTNKRNSGHESEMLLPMINEAKELVSKGNSIMIRGEEKSFIAPFALVTLDYMEVPKNFNCFYPRSYYPCIVCLFFSHHRK